MPKEGNEIFLDSVLMDARTENRLSQGIKIVYKSKTYNYYGFSRDKGYIVISSAILEEGFIIGDIFQHSIPIDISPFPLNKKLYYKKVEAGDVDDYYAIRHKSEYRGYECRCAVYSTGYVKVEIDTLKTNYSERALPSDDERIFYDLGFLSFAAGDYPTDSRKIYVNDKILLSDENLKFSCIKQYYEKQGPYPFDEMKCNKDDDVEIIDLKPLYAEWCK